jgi:general secretion pathway protein E
MSASSHQPADVVVPFPEPVAEAPAADADAAADDFDHGLCEHLIAAGKLTRTGVERAERLRAEQTSPEPLRTLLVKLGLVSEGELAAAMAEILGLRLVERRAFPEPGATDDALPLNFLKTRRLLILGEMDVLGEMDGGAGDGAMGAGAAGRLLVAMADPRDAQALKAVRLATGREVQPCVAVASEIEQALEERARRADGGGDDALELRDGAYEDDVEHLKELASGAPVVKLVNQLLHRAVETRASDIHIEPFESHLKVRYRVDGVLRELEAQPAASAAAVISRIKVMAGLNIAERRLPQDGRYKIRVAGEMIDLRISTVPTVYGESVVMRLLRREAAAQDFGDLGYGPDVEQALLRVLDLPYGILLVTGPTGSGKSTTLYAALRHLNTAARKIIAVEDPVEYNIEGVNQIQVKPQIGLTFANALRSIVRQDPDVIMVGEMRDTETAKIAVQSALTGHLVLSTLHTNDAAGSITRMLDMGVEDYLLASTVNAVMAQRLVRNLCPACREPYAPSPEEAGHWRLERFTNGADPVLYRAAGCEQCDGIGYRGRSAIVELLVMSEPIRRLVLAHAEAGRIAQQAAAEGTRSMFEDGLMKSLAGRTTVEEVLRVTQEG